MAGRNTDSFFREVKAKWSGPVRIWVFVGFLALAIVGAVFWAEDTWSSYQGIRALEVQYDLNAVTWEETYWAGAVAAQLLQMVFMYIFLANTKANRPYLFFAIAAFVVDFLLDAMYRSNGYIGGPERLIALGANTMIFSALSEVFITLGIGASLTLLPGAIAEFFALFGIRRQQKPQQRGKKPQQKPRQPQQRKGKTQPRKPVPADSEEIERQMQLMREQYATGR